VNIPRHPFPELRDYQKELKKAYFDPEITELDVAKSIIYNLIVYQGIMKIMKNHKAFNLK